MVDISHESAEETDSRLRRVISTAELKIYDDRYAFTEFGLDQFPSAVSLEALALVRDDEVWSQLVPYSGSSDQSFAIWRFHFPSGVDNSGFVGWLATHLKSRFGTGIFVVCGQNTNRGGIFDYWGCPAEIAEDVVEEVKLLVAASSQA